MRELSRDPARDPSRNGSRDQLLVAVRQGIAVARDTGDLGPLRALERQGAVTRLVISMDDARWPDLAALHAVGMARWLQYVTGPEGAHQAEWEASLQPLSCVYAGERDAVPPEAAAVLEAVRSGRRLSGPRIPREVRRWVLSGLRLREELSPDFVEVVRGLDPRGGQPHRDARALRPFLDRAPRHLPSRVRALRLLTVTLQMSYRATGDAATLAEAVRLGRELLLLVPAGGARWADAVAQHARVVGDHYRHTHDRRDVDEAVDCGREALRHTPPDSAWLASRLDEFGLHLSLRYDVSGAATDLNAAIDASRGAVRATPTGAPDATSYRARLAGLLVKRHRATGDGAALDEAVQLVRREAHPLPPQGRAGVLLDHAEVLHAQYRRTGLASVLHDALALYREAVDDRRARGGNPTDLAIALSHLGNALYDLCADFPGEDRPAPGGPPPAEPSALGEAVAVHREAVAVSAPDDPQRPGYLNNLARTLRERARRDDGPDALDEAISLLREAIESARPGHVFRSAMLSHLSAALLERQRHSGADEPEPKLIREAYAFAEAAARSAAGPPGELIRLHRALAELASSTGRHREAAAAYARAVALLPQAVPHQLHGSESETQLARHGRGLAADAAAAVLQAGGPDAPARALEILEQGRGILLARALGLHGEEEALRDAAPALADRLAGLRAALDTAPTGADPADRRHQLADEWELVVAEARRLPGLEGFLKPPRLATLRPAAAGGPVVTVNTSPLRCDALILTSGGVAAVPLPALTHAEAASRAERFAEALRTAEAHGTALVDRLAAQAYLRETLTWLWDAAAAPVLTHLARTTTFPHTPHTPATPATTATPPHPPRIWLSTTGPLAQLPLHAAGDHDDPSGTRSLLDRAVPSYTPTVAALAAAVRTAARRGARPHRPVPLVVAMPRTAGFAPLAGALTEARAAADRYGTDTVLLTGDEATRARLLAALPASTHVHFACHAVADPTSPYGSHLILDDQPLTVSEISRLRLARGEFCYLSACATARSGRLPDESVHIGGAFHLAGFGQVVATLWPVEDTTAAETARLFHTSPHPTPAHALHQAVRTLRANAPRLPSRWAGHVHIGP